MNSAEQFFVLTGGPGAGKTTLIQALCASGFATTTEAGRGVIQAEMQSNGTALPWADPPRFAKRMFEWELCSYRQAEHSRGPVFFDRGLPDTIGYLRLEGLGVPAWMEEQTLRLRYHARVFIAPPWKAIYGRDEERRQNWPLAVRTYEIMAETYTDMGYSLVELPCGPVTTRLRFVLDKAGV